MNDRTDRNNTCTLMAIVYKSGNLIQSVVGATGYGNGGEPFHISKVFRSGFGSGKNLLDNPIW